MPLYEYRCAGCGARFEKLRGMSEKDAPLGCPKCGEEKAHRQLSVFASAVSGGTRGCGFNEATGTCSNFG
jgi:putative FmdB family regulatory protein